ncbi:MAG: T9SS type A sorting domain-containing protein [Chitinophagaceae bacterium]
MKTIVRLIIIFQLFSLELYSQITVPSIKARFGVDADVRANFFNGFVQTGNDDWYNQVATDTAGKSVIDTTGAAALVAAYLSDVSPWPKRMQSVYRTMSKPAFSIINNRLWLDAIWVRDYHGNDTTVFTAGSDKNGMSPVNWTGGVQSIPDKNDILDMFVHVRRAGPNTTDSLWLFGGLSLDNTTGNRYFDFEMYQTDIYYDRPSGKWFGYGPDFGHTSWQFDAAGNVSKPGDIIFSAEYQSSTLTNIEARVWVQKTVWQTVTPTAFNWSGQFDGASSGATYGYASILPKTAGAFYTGLGSANNTWGGPFRVVLQDNTLSLNYARDQFMEFSVNLSKLGLDPVTLLGGDICGTPFNRIVVKTRASASFTAELKDFVAPTDLFLAPRADIVTQTPFICDTGSVAQIYVVNPSPTSFYQWSTPNGRIVGPTTGPLISVDTPGIYIVKQYLQAGCSMYASDTITINRFANCFVLENNLADFRGMLNKGTVQLNWRVLENQYVKYFIIEKSIDGIHFEPLNRVDADPSSPHVMSYAYNDDISRTAVPGIYYRIRMKDINNNDKFSHVILVSLSDLSKNSIAVFPNPVKEDARLQISSLEDGEAEVSIYDETGRKVSAIHTTVRKGTTVIPLNGLSGKPNGSYQVVVILGKEMLGKKIVLSR